MLSDSDTVYILCWKIYFDTFRVYVIHRSIQLCYYLAREYLYRDTGETAKIFQKRKDAYI